MLRHTQSFYKPIDFQESYLAVDIFFVLSGVVIANAYDAKLLAGQPVAHFMRARLIRLAPLYLLGGVLGLIAAIVNKSASLGALIALVPLYIFYLPNLFGIDGGELFPFNRPAWSLFFELVANFVYGTLIKYLSMRRLALFCAVCAAGLVLYAAFARTLDIGYLRTSFPAGLFRVGYSFFVGVLLYRIFAQVDVPRVTGVRASFVTSGILVLVAAVLMADPTPFFRPYFDVLAVVVVFPAVVFCALFFEPDGWLAQLCSFMGVTSYALYALHVPVGQLTRSGIHKVLGIDINSYAPLTGLLFLPFFIVLCAAIDKRYDEPIRRLLNRTLNRYGSTLLGQARLREGRVERAEG
jgi:peptidoglycan/LPS O-acetylase OafA/YrhL